MGKTQERLINNLQIQLRRLQQDNERLQQENEHLRSLAYRATLKVGAGGAAVDDIVARADETRAILENHIKKLEAQLEEYAAFVPHEIAQPALADEEGQKMIETMQTSAGAKVMSTTHDKATVVCITIAARTEWSKDCPAKFSVSKVIAVYPGSVADVHRELPGMIESLITRSPVESELRYRAIPGLEDEHGRALVLEALRDVASYWHLEDFRSTYFDRLKGAFDHYLAPSIDWTRIDPADAYDRWRKTVEASFEAMSRNGRGQTEKPRGRLRQFPS